MTRLQPSPLLALALLALLAAPLAGLAEDPAPTPPAAPDPTAKLTVAVDTVWVLVTGMLVFFMNLGFGCVESGFCRAKNCVNIVSKNFVVFAATSIGFWLLGWGLMFGDGTDWFGTQGLLAVSGADNSPATGDDYKGVYSAINWTGVPLWAKFFFQLVFAGTAATIVSGAVAERIKYHSFILFTFFMAIVVYPICGHWIWGGGLLADKHLFGEGRAMFDFAGSTVVHSVGGWAALAGVIMLGPRLGKYGPGGKINAIPGHNMTAAFIGCLVLWFGWFGFNPGSSMGLGDPNLVARVAVTTNTAAAAGTLAATVTAWLLLGKPDIGMTLNGCLAGLVAITAPCACVTVPVSVVIGLVAGILVVLSVLMFDRLRIDDPVGALSVHLVNGIWGTLAVGLFALKEIDGSTTGVLNDGLLMGGGLAQLLPQVTGIALVGAYVFVAALLGWALLKYTVGIRVTPQEELEGLDLGEHGNEAYHGFLMAAGTDGASLTFRSEPRPAQLPPDGHERYTVVVEGADDQTLMNAWSTYCQPGSKPASAHFLAVYPYMTTVTGSRFRFRGGNPEDVRESLLHLLQERVPGKSLRTRVEV